MKGVRRTVFRLPRTMYSVGVAFLLGIIIGGTIMSVIFRLITGNTKQQLAAQQKKEYSHLEQLLQSLTSSQTVAAMQ